MAKLTFVSRADDFGSSLSANQAIEAVTRAGFIRNVSVMAPGPAVEDAARLLAGRKELCFGMHTTLNAEWDRVKWGPVLPLDSESGLTDENGHFLSNPSMFVRTKPDVELILREMDAQLEKLHALGFDIRYIDSHMLPELFVKGLYEAMEEFIRRKGLIDHMYFYNPLPGVRGMSAVLPGIAEYLKTLAPGQYFFITHPALDTEEMRMTGNERYRGEDIAKGRAYEAGVFSDPALCERLRGMGCEGVRYDEATPGKRVTLAEARAIFAGG